MEWPKLKNIILVILAMTNLCLFFFVAQREWQQYHFQNQARKDVVAFLASRSITVDPDILPRDRDTLPPLTVVRDLEQEATLAAGCWAAMWNARSPAGGVPLLRLRTAPSSFITTGPFLPALPKGLSPPTMTPPPARPSCWNGWTSPES